MADITTLTENFEGGSNGVALSTTNSIFNNLANPNSSIVFVNDPVEGLLSARLSSEAVSTRTARVDITSRSLVWWSWYIKVVTLPTVDSGILNWWSATAKVGDIQLQADGSIALRDNNTTRWTSPPVPVGSWFRMDIKAQPGSATGHRIRLFTGASVNSTTATFDSGDVAATDAAQTEISSFRVLNSGADGHIIQIDRIRGDDSAAPTPIGTSSLQARLASLISAIGADVKSLQTKKCYRDAVFSDTGAVATFTGTSRWYAENACSLVSFRASLGTAGTTTTTVVVKKNGSAVTTMTLINGVSTITNTVPVSMLTGDYLTVDVTTAGTGASDLTVQMRVAE